MRAKSAVLHPGKGHANCGLLGAVCVALVECTHACFRPVALWTEHLLLGYRVAGLAGTAGLSG